MLKNVPESLHLGYTQSPTQLSGWIFMASARMSFLDRNEEDTVHVQSIACLEKIGVLIRSRPVLEMLSDAGCDIDWKKQIALIPEELIIESVHKAPTEFKLCSRVRRNDIPLPSKGQPYITTDGLTIYMIDLETGQKRDATRKDLGDFARLADALEQIDFFWPIVTVSEVPQQCHPAFEMWTSLLNCTMHVQGDSLSVEDAMKQVALASLVAGGGEELRKRPLFSVAIDPVAPLSFEKGAVEAQVILSKAGIPILAHSMTLTGMSSPTTVAGTVVNINSENLASLVISQVASPGSPHIYGSSSVPINMTTGSMNYFAPEGAAISAAAGQMARRYGRPCMVGDWGAGVNGLGMDASFCEHSAHFMTMFSGTDLAPGIGSIDCAKGCSFEQMIIDAALWDQYKSFLRRFTVDEKSIALDVVREVGHGNSFLTHPHTAMNFKRELFFWDRKKLEMQATLSDRMVAGARETAKKLLSEHTVEPVDRDIVQEGERILAEYAKSHS